MSRPGDWWILGLSDDPAPGEPFEVDRLAGQLEQVAADARDAHAAVRSLAGDQAVLAWVGASGDVFRGAIGKFPGQLEKLHTSYSLAADAVRGWAGDLRNAQAEADRALGLGREAHAQVMRLGPQVDAAQSTLRAAVRDAGAAATVPAPDPEQVRAAVRAQQQAQASYSQLSDSLASAQGQLDAAKRLAEQARQLRESSAGRASARIHDAADAGIPPDSFWHKVGEIASAVWHGIITVAKIVVAVGGIIALIVGGPIAWIVVGAALLVLVDTLVKYEHGQASLFDVAMAALNCIPMTKGLTSVAELRAAFEARGGLAGIFAAGGVLGRAFVKPPVEAFRGARELWEGRAALPAMVHALPYRAAGRAYELSQQIRLGGADTLRAFVLGLGEDGSIVGRVRRGWDNADTTWTAGATALRRAAEAGDNPALGAIRWQREAPYGGIDIWRNEVAPAGTRFEALAPGFSGFVAPEGTFAAAGHDASAVSQGLQVAPQVPDGQTILHSYRGHGVTFELRQDTSVATAVAHANTQYGAGGLTQHFVPSLAKGLESGDIVAFGAHGEPVTIGHDASNRLALLVDDHHLIPLSDVDLPADTRVLTSKVFASAHAKVLGGFKPVYGFVKDGYDWDSAIKELSKTSHETFALQGQSQ